jgi:hypothetical protein
MSIEKNISVIATNLVGKVVNQANIGCIIGDSTKWIQLIFTDGSDVLFSSGEKNTFYNGAVFMEYDDSRMRHANDEDSTVISFYEVLIPTDACEDRGPWVPHARFWNERDALDLVKQKEFYSAFGVMGMKMDPKKAVRKVSLTIHHRSINHSDMVKDNIRKQALAKLTAEERKALGV